MGNHALKPRDRLVCALVLDHHRHHPDAPLLRLEEIRNLVNALTGKTWSLASIGRSLARVFNAPDARGKSAYRAALFDGGPPAGFVTRGDDGTSSVEAVWDRIPGADE